MRTLDAAEAKAHRDQILEDIQGEPILIEQQGRRDIGKLDVQQFVADKFPTQAGWQTVRNAWTLLSDEPYKTMVELIAATGLRVGELLAVRWRVIDLEIGTLAVRESVYERKFQRPKTSKSRRRFPWGLPRSRR